MSARRKFKVTSGNGEECYITIEPLGVRGELEEMFVKDLLELNMTDWAVEEVYEATTRWAVFDFENDCNSVGPFDTPEEAEAFVTERAEAEGWGDVTEALARGESVFSTGLTLSCYEEVVKP